MDIEDMRDENLVVAYVNGKAIVVNQWGDYFFAEIPDNMVEIGEAMAISDLTSIDELSIEEHDEILDEVENLK